MVVNESRCGLLEEVYDYGSGCLCCTPGGELNQRLSNMLMWGCLADLGDFFGSCTAKLSSKVCDHAKVEESCEQYTELSAMEKQISNDFMMISDLSPKFCGC